MSAVATALALAYLLASGVVALYALSQLHLLWRASRGGAEPAPPADGEDLPLVVVQLPLFNERRAVRRLLDAVAALDWPALHVQVLDDSTDETTAIAEEVCVGLRARGRSFEVVRRPDRVGYKAGALATGLAQTDAAYIAIFDADFRPPPDFLRRAMGHLLAHPELGLVQARWGHLDRDRSVLTRSLALHLDAHFGVEQVARSAPPLLMGFNGTAGVWRRACIEAGGGWHADTLTEDLDLSLRCQLAGWRLGYLDALEAPAELPDDVRAIRAQQHRWMKGGAQVARKLLGPLWRSSLPLVAKVQGTVHLCGGMVFGAVLLLCLITPALPQVRAGSALAATLLTPAGPLLQGVLGVLVLFYGTSCWRREPTGALALRRLLTTLPTFLVLSTGMALHNAAAVVEGWSGVASPFVRTPKRGDSPSDGALYAVPTAGLWPLLEGALAVWGAWGAAWAIAGGEWVSACFLASQALGFGAVALGRRA